MIDGTLIGTSTLGQSGLVSVANEGVLQISQSLTIRCSLVSYLGDSLGLGVLSLYINADTKPYLLYHLKFSFVNNIKFLSKCFNSVGFCSWIILNVINFCKKI